MASKWVEKGMEFIMKNEDVLEILNDISSYLYKEKYHEILKYIEKKKTEIKDKRDPVSEYIDDLVDSLK